MLLVMMEPYGQVFFLPFMEYNILRLQLSHLGRIIFFCLSHVVVCPSVSLALMTEFYWRLKVDQQKEKPLIWRTSNFISKDDYHANLNGVVNMP